MLIELGVPLEALQIDGLGQKREGQGDQEGGKRQQGRDAAPRHPRGPHDGSGSRRPHSQAQQGLVATRFKSECRLESAISGRGSEIGFGREPQGCRLFHRWRLSETKSIALLLLLVATTTTTTTTTTTMASETTAPPGTLYIQGEGSLLVSYDRVKVSRRLPRASWISLQDESNRSSCALLSALPLTPFSPSSSRTALRFTSPFGAGPSASTPRPLPRPRTKRPLAPS